MNGVHLKWIDDVIEAKRRSSRSWRRDTEVLSVYSRLTSSETCRQTRIETKWVL